MIAALVQLSQLVADQPAIGEMIVNPLLAGPDGVLATNGELRLVKTRRGVHGEERLAIRPYPKSLERAIRLRDGTEVRMRPIRPEDARAMQRAFLKMTPEDRRMRLFTPVSVLRDDLAARGTAIDYDREMALVIEDPEHPGELWGGARIGACILAISSASVINFSTTECSASLASRNNDNQYIVSFALFKATS